MMEREILRMLAPLRAVAAALLLVGWSASAEATGPESVASLAEKLLPMVVNISTTQKPDSATQVPIPDLPEGSPFKDFFDEFFEKQQREGGEPPPRRMSSLGSGFVVDPTGFVVTNNHVIEGAEEIEVNFPDGRNLKATVIGRDSKTDLAVLKVEPDQPLASAVFGDSDALRVGDWVLAIGNPFGLGGSVTLGIVSARNRDISAGPYDDFIQTDAAINRGNSGGPLFNMQGEVVGINTAIISPSGGSIGIGFSVPANTARGIITQLKDFGETRRGWLGVKIQTVTPDIAEGLGLAKPQGALVADVTAAGPAEKSGIRAGDVIISFNGKPIREMRDLPRLVAETTVGTSVDVIVQRKSEQKTLKVAVGRLEEAEKAAAQLAAATPDPSSPEAQSTEVLGMKLAMLDSNLRQQFKIASHIEGVVVVEVDPESRAAKDNRIEPGDVITEADQREARVPKDIADRAKELEGRGKNSMLVLISKSAQQGELRFIALKLKG
jgi:serine protease Do